jgi:hypothetical protein
MISGKSFADRCDWIVDPRYPSQRKAFHCAMAPAGDWVFVNGDYLDAFRSRIPFGYTKQYTIVVHNSDRPFGEAELRLLLPHANHIYAINTTIRHPKLTTIPLGFVDRQLPLLAEFKRPDVERTYEIYANFSTGTNVPARLECINAFKNDPRLVVRPPTLGVSEYLADLCKSKFVLCPEGTGIDTHRVYESLLCGATPVVKRNSLSHLYETLPVCIVDNWSDPFTVPTDKAFRGNIADYLVTRS